MIKLYYSLDIARIMSYDTGMMTQEQLDRLRRWVDMPKRDLRIALCMNTNGFDNDAFNETRGMTRGELIARWIEENGLGA